MTLEGWAEAARQGSLSPVLLVRGDRVLAEPLAERLAAELGAAWETVPQRLRHPEELAAVLADLRTFSLFGGGKLVVAVETGALADRAAAESMLAGAAEALPFAGGADELTGAAREGARRLLQVLRLHDIDPSQGEPAQLLAALPAALFGRSKGGVDEARARFEPLLAAALEAGLRGSGEADATLLADALRDGLPERHALVLVESAVAASHPLVEALARRDAVVDAGSLVQEKQNVAGLERLVETLERETGASIQRAAASELARRTLRPEESRAKQKPVDADSASRFAAEYRKLAALSGGRTIGRDLVEANVEDRGDEDVWSILDAIGEGNAASAWTRIERRLAASDDRIRERLALFSLLASFARQLAATGGALAATGARAGESFYPRFKDSVAPRLQGEIEGVESNPIGTLHPFRLHRVYLAASRWPARELATLPARVLETERRLKGDSDDPDSALAELVMTMARRELSSSPASRAGSRRRGGGGGRS